MTDVYSECNALKIRRHYSVAFIKQLKGKLPRILFLVKAKLSDTVVPSWLIEVSAPSSLFEEEV